MKEHPKAHANKGPGPQTPEYLGLHPALTAVLWRSTDLKENTEFISECVRKADTWSKHRGKYAFIRAAHAQEPLSAFFSLLAFASVLFHIRHLKRYDPKPKGTSQEVYAKALGLTFYAHALCWLSSFSFHVRDTYTTQCADYLLAMLGMLSSMCLGCIKVFGLQTGKLAALASSVFFLGHAGYLLIIHFNFEYNKVACGTVLAANMLIGRMWHARTRSACRKKVLSLGGTGLSIAFVFQVVDFGPVLFLIDSHAIWHILAFLFASTVYQFYLLEAEEAKAD